jgi:hypothetical protein
MLDKLFCYWNSRREYFNEGELSVVKSSSIFTNILSFNYLFSFYLLLIIVIYIYSIYTLPKKDEIVPL